MLINRILNLAAIIFVICLLSVVYTFIIPAESTSSSSSSSTASNKTKKTLQVSIIKKQKLMSNQEIILNENIETKPHQEWLALVSSSKTDKDQTYNDSDSFDQNNQFNRQFDEPVASSRFWLFNNQNFENIKASNKSNLNKLKEDVIIKNDDDKSQLPVNSEDKNQINFLASQQKQNDVDQILKIKESNRNQRIKRWLNFQNESNKQRKYDRQERDISSISSFSSTNQNKDISNIYKDLDMESKIFYLHNRCSQGYISFNNRTDRISAHFHFNNFSDIRLTFIPSRYEGFAIRWQQHNKFLCIDPNTSSIIAKDCFEWCLCSFKEELSDDYSMYSLASKPELKLSFNNRGEPLAFNSSAYLKRKKYLSCRHFIKRDENQIVNLNRLIYSEDMSCDWKKTGEQIFDKELRKNPRFDCILSNYPQLLQLSAPKHRKHQQKLSKRKMKHKTTNLKNQNSTNIQVDRIKSTTELIQPKPKYESHQLNLPEVIITPSKSNRCIPYKKGNGPKQKIRHLTKKARVHLLC